MSELQVSTEYRYRLLVEGVKDYAMLLLDQEGRIVVWNAGAERILGWTQAEVLGQPGDLIFTPDDRAAGVPAQELEEAASEGKARDLRWHLKKDGTRFFANGLTEGLRDEAGLLRGFAKILRDATVEKYADDQGRQMREELRAAHERTAGILESITDSFFAVDSEWRFTYLNDQAEKQLLRPRAELLGKNVWEEFPAAAGSAFEREYRRAVDEQTVVIFEEYYPPPLDTWFEVRAYPSEGGLAIFFQNVNARRRAEEALKRSREDLRFAIDAAHLGTFYCDWPLDKIVWNATCKEHFFLPLDADVDFDLFYSLLHPDDREPTRQAIERAFAERVEYDVEYRTLAPDGRTRWVNAVGRFHYGADGDPLRFDGITIDISERKATEQEIRQHAEREALLNRIGQALRASSDPQVVRETAVTLLGQALGVDRCYVALYDLTGGTVRVTRDWRRDGLPSIQGLYPFPNTAEMFRELYRGSSTSVIADGYTASLSPQTLANMEGLGLRSRVSVALADAAGLTAALTAAMTDGPRDWTAEEVALVEAVATQLRLGVEAARVQQREHQIAVQLQDALQPVPPDHIPGLTVGRFTKPALDEAQIGGDFYDIFPLDKNLYAVVIGDVSGKGLAAAQQLALIRNSLRTTLYLYRAPAQAAASLNAIVTAHDLLAGFVTAFVAVYDAGTGGVVYCSCGHEPGLLRRAGGGVEELQTTGPPLGAAENATYSEETVTLSSADALLLYTDGVSEAGPNRSALLGTTGLMRLFGALSVDDDVQTQAEALVGEVSAYAGGVFRDDVAVLLARRQ